MKYLKQLATIMPVMFISAAVSLAIPLYKKINIGRAGTEILRQLGNYPCRVCRETGSSATETRAASQTPARTQAEPTQENGQSLIQCKLHVRV